MQQLHLALPASIHRAEGGLWGAARLTLCLVTLQNDGTVITVRNYLRQHFNFRYDMLGVAVAVLCAYILLLG